MNLSLLDPFAVAKEFPDTLTQTLSYGHSTCIKTNLNGDYLASGTSDGAILVIDTDTNSTIMILRDHVRSITSLSWSLCGRYILSSSRDWKCNLWDLKSGRAIRSIIFDGPVWLAYMNPTNSFQFVAALFEDDAVLVDWSMQDPKNYTKVKLNTEPIKLQQNGLDDGNENDVDSEEEDNSKRKVSHWTLTCCFTSDGKYILTGTSKGWLNIITVTDTMELKTVYSLKVCNANVKNIYISSDSSKLVINSSDRIIRQYSINLQDSERIELELENRYQDMVNRLQWNSIKLNHNSEYLCASTWGSSHDLYIWETNLGSLIKILEGPNEELIEVDWNFRKCIINAIGVDSGVIYIWSVNFPQKWSALAPDFEEIEENIDYDEKEDEFDLVDDDELMDIQIKKEDDNQIDIITKETVDARGLPILSTFVIDFNLQELN